MQRSRLSQPTSSQQHRMKDIMIRCLARCSFNKNTAWFVPEQDCRASNKPSINNSDKDYCNLSIQIFETMAYVERSATGLEFDQELAVKSDGIVNSPDSESSVMIEFIMSQQRRRSSRLSWRAISSVGLNKPRPETGRHSNTIRIWTKPLPGLDQRCSVSRQSPRLWWARFSRLRPRICLRRLQSRMALFLIVNVRPITQRPFEEDHIRTLAGVKITLSGLIDRFPLTGQCQSIMNSTMIKMIKHLHPYKFNRIGHQTLQIRVLALFK